MILTTTSTIEGQPITQYIGVVAGETVVGINILKDFGAGLRNIVGGRAGSYEKEIMAARESTMQEMAERALAWEADAIVGISFDYEAMGSDNGMIMVTVTGTAVKVA